MTDQELREALTATATARDAAVEARRTREDANRAQSAADDARSAAIAALDEAARLTWLVGAAVEAQGKPTMS